MSIHCFCVLVSDSPMLRVYSLHVYMISCLHFSPHATGSPSPTVTDARTWLWISHILRARPRPRSRTRVHDCEIHIGFSQWRPRLDPNGAPLGRYMTIIDVRQFAHHRHHVTIHAEWGRRCKWTCAYTCEPSVAGHGLLGWLNTTHCWQSHQFGRDPQLQHETTDSFRIRPFQLASDKLSALGIVLSALGM